DRHGRHPDLDGRALQSLEEAKRFSDAEAPDTDRPCRAPQRISVLRDGRRGVQLFERRRAVPYVNGREHGAPKPDPSEASKAAAEARALASGGMLAADVHVRR